MPEPEILRIARKEEWAKAYMERALEILDMRRAQRAVNFLNLLDARGRGILGAEVSTFNSFR